MPFCFPVTFWPHLVFIHTSIHSISLSHNTHTLRLKTLKVPEKKDLPFFIVFFSAFARDKLSSSSVDDVMALKDNDMHGNTGVNTVKDFSLISFLEHIFDKETVLQPVENGFCRRLQLLALIKHLMHCEKGL